MVRLGSKPAFRSVSIADLAPRITPRPGKIYLSTHIVPISPLLSSELPRPQMYLPGRREIRMDKARISIYEHTIIESREGRVCPLVNSPGIDRNDV